MKRFVFTVDDNIRFLQDLTKRHYDSIFDHPYLAVYLRLHKKYQLKVQLNLFYEGNGFDLSQMTDEYKNEWVENADWLKLSFHSKLENVNPYINSQYQEVFEDCQNVQREIIRFATDKALGKTTTVHYCQTTDDGIKALYDNGVRGLLGLYGKESAPMTSYQNNEEECQLMRKGEVVHSGGINYAAIDIVLNACTTEGILLELNNLACRDLVKVMIHEQYFYPDYFNYQPDFEEKITATFDWLVKNGFTSVLFEELL